MLPDRIDELRRKNISKNIADLEFEGEQVAVSVDGEAATLTGSAPSQEGLEKLVLFDGNQHGIGSVNRGLCAVLNRRIVSPG